MSTSSKSTKTPWAGTLLAHGPSWLAATALFALMVMTFFDVVLRSAVNNPIESATELTRLFMAIIVFSSLPIVTWKGMHISVDLLDPFHRTVELLLKFEPFTVRVKPSLPARTLLGEIEPIVGAEVAGGCEGVWDGVPPQPMIVKRIPAMMNANRN